MNLAERPSVTFGSMSPLQADDEVKFRCSGIETQTLHDEFVHVRSRRTDTSHTLSPTAFAILQICRQPDTIRGHAARLVRRMHGGTKLQPAGPDIAHIPSSVRPAPPPEALAAYFRGHLADLVSKGLLIREEEFRSELLAAWRQSAAVDTADRIRSVAIPSRNRPESLLTTLESYLESGRRHERSPRYVVVDESDRPADRAKIQDGMRRLKALYGAEVYYADRSTKMRFAKLLAARSRIPLETIAFGLLGGYTSGSTLGASRNMLLLLAAGEMSLQVDDDVPAHTVTIPSRSGGLELTSATDPWQYWFYPDADALSRALSPSDEDILQAHEQLLGRRVIDCVRTLADDSEVELSRMDDRFRKRIGPESRVAVSMTGVAGDSGMYGTRYRLFLRGPSLDRLVENEDAYGDALRTHQLLKAVSCPTIADGAYPIVAALALDHRRLLPPFMPVQRDEFGVFGSVLKCCFRDAFGGYVPSAVRHVPPEDRTILPDRRMRQIGPPNANGLLSSVIRYKFSGENDAFSLHDVGAQLTAWGSLPPNLLSAFAQAAFRREVDELIEFAERRLDERAGRPDFWARDVRTYVQAVQAAARSRDADHLWDLEGEREEKTQLWGRLMREYGELLIHWPAIVQAARELHAEGMMPLQDP